jgi:hypothetical protein
MDDTYRDPLPYVIREVPNARPGKKVRIGIVGFSEAKPTGPGQKRLLCRLRIDDLFEAARSLA